jgi:hypothetical protein
LWFKRNVMRDGILCAGVLGRGLRVRCAGWWQLLLCVLSFWVFCMVCIFAYMTLLLISYFSVWYCWFISLTCSVFVWGSGKLVTWGLVLSFSFVIRIMNTIVSILGLGWFDSHYGRMQWSDVIVGQWLVWLSSGPNVRAR